MSDFEQLRHVDLCSEIGGFALGFQRAGLSYPVLFCDIEEWCRDVLDKHWPDVPKAVDVKELAHDPIRNVPDCDILTAGYPCQPFSVAGQRKGQEDDRHIWPYILQIVAQKRPTWCVFENVYGHISLGLDQVLFDLEAESYAARAFVVPACAVDAPHRRDRVWIIARNVGDTQHNGSPASAVKGKSQETSDNESEGQSKASQSKRASQSRDSASMEGSTRADNVGDTDSQQRGATPKDRGLDLDRAVLDQRQGREETDAPERSGGNVAYTDSKRGRGGNAERENATPTRQSPRNQRDNARGMETWLPEPNVGRVAHGVSRRVDRLKGLGNAIVPQIAEQIAITIKQVG